ncbi:nucleotide disphospho-sugar-binding domain-containing protein [Patulibacter sp. NPDC049589]|uniref:glycosyltransferase n=1 Tax=Patulibacter sp. NPDC049589 TaxID=3154731 RepID=UPI0034242C79
MATLLAYTSPAAGHAFPLVPGLLALRARGHDVHVRTAAGLVEPLRAAGLAAEAVDPAIEALAAGGERDGVRGELRHQLRRARLDAADLDRVTGELDPDAVIVDVAAWGATVAAEASGRPFALSNPYLSPLPAPGRPPFGPGLAPRGGPAGSVRDAVARALVRHAGSHAVLPTLNALRAARGLPPVRDVLAHLGRPQIVLQLSGGPLEPPRPSPPASLRLVGLQRWDPASSAAAPAWLDEPGDPWVLVTCSTDRQRDGALAAAAIEAFRDEPVRLLVTLGAAARDPDLPAAPNARVAAFLPHAPVLARAAAVVCHGGMGIVGKALGAGVALVVVPYGRDQPEVAARVEAAGLGARVRPDGLTPATLLAAYRRAQDRRPAVQKEAAAMATMDAAGAFADAAEELLSERG